MFDLASDHLNVWQMISHHGYAARGSVDAPSCAGPMRISNCEAPFWFFSNLRPLYLTIYSSLGVNMLWRSALLTAARNLRQNMLRGRIWGNPASDVEQGQDQEREQGDVPFTSPLYASSSSSLDLPLNGEDVESGSQHRPTWRLRVRAKTNGRVRGMVDKWERESAGSRNSDHGCHRSSSESDSGSELGECEVAAVAEGDVDAHGACSEPVSLSLDKAAAPVPAEDFEPSMEDLLAAEPAPSAPRDGSWGARAWEELDSAVTMRRAEQHDTVVPRRDASSGISADMGSPAIFGTRSKRGGSASSSSQRIRATATREDSRHSRRMAADIFAEPSDTISTPALAEAEVQADMRVEIELEEEGTVAALEAELEAKELALESEARSTRALLEDFKRRLEDVEGRVSAMEAERHRLEEEVAHVSQQSQAQGSSASEKDTCDDAVETLPKTTGVTLEHDDAAAEVPADDSQAEGHSAAEKGSADLGIPDAEGHVVRHSMVDIGPTSVSDLPSYVFLVGLGVCAVVLQVVLKRVGGRSLKP